MKLLSKKAILLPGFICVIFCSCINNVEPEQNGFTPDAQVFVDRILKENNISKYNLDIISSTGESGLGTPVGYHLGLIVGRSIVLTNTIDSLRVHGIYRFNKSDYGTGGGMVNLSFMGVSAKCDTLDSIKIITDTVIRMQDLGLGFCNLTHLPPEIGKLRVRSLDITYSSLTDLPLEIMHILDQPKGYPYTIIDWSGSKKFKFDSLPDTLKNWFNDVYSNQNFPKN